MKNENPKRRVYKPMAAVYINCDILKTHLFPGLSKVEIRKSKCGESLVFFFFCYYCLFRTRNYSDRPASRKGHARPSNPILYICG